MDIEPHIEAIAAGIASIANTVEAENTLSEELVNPMGQRATTLRTEIHTWIILIPQLVQIGATGAAGMSDAVVVRILCPQFVQNAISFGTSE